MKDNKMISNCNCDEGFTCKACLYAEDEKIQEMKREYERYCIKDENGKLVDVRDEARVHDEKIGSNHY